MQPLYLAPLRQLTLHGVRSKGQVITQAAIEAAKAASQAMTEAAGLSERTNGATGPACMRTRTSKPSLKQTIFYWKAQDKYDELLNLEMKVKKNFMTKSYDISDSKRVHITMNWL